MRATVTQLDATNLDAMWPGLVAHTRASGSEFVLLPEMPFSQWLAGSADVDPAAWVAAVDAHREWATRLGELGAAVVVSTRPIVDREHRYNEAFVWSDGVLMPWRRKTYLPDEPGFWEATWYDRGPVDFTSATSPFGPIGIQICTEMWFYEHARAYGRDGIRLVLTPRATEASTTDKWLAGGRVSAISAGAFSLSSNHSGTHGDAVMGGTGWIVSPDGEVLATTAAGAPFVTVDIDLDTADRAKTTYPRYVDESPV